MPRGELTRGPESFGAMVRRYRLARGLTQEEVAGLAGAGLSVDTVSAIERGRSRPYRATLESLLQALALTADERVELLAAWRAKRPSPVTPEETGPVAASSTRGPPAPISVLVGREAELAAVEALLRNDEVRLVTLVGPGGVGKTSVAQEVVHAPAVTEKYHDTVAWVDLATLTGSSQLLAALLRGLGVPEESGTSPLDRVVAHLGRRRVLLVLDNCERVADGGPDLVEVLRRCPATVALTTSRTPLQVRGEHLVQIVPLRLPEAAERADLERAGQSPAVELFVERARAADADFTLTAENVETISEICARLDGLPLALELAAVRLTLFSPRELLGRLNRGMTWMSSGPRDLPDRQRTLDATVAWSYELLSPTERAVFCSLTVFVGGCTLDAIEAVAAGPVPAAQLLEVVETLQLQSLLVGSGGDGDRRFTMLETVRAAGQRCLSADERRRLRARHVRYYLGLLEEAAPHLPGADRGGWLDRLDADRDNLRTALSWAQRTRSLTLTVSLLDGLGWLWYFRGPLSEGREWMADAWETSDLTAEPLTRATAGWHAGRLAHLQGDEETAQVLLGASVELWRQVDDERGLGYALADLGQVRWLVGELADGRRLAAESVQRFRRTADRWGLGLALQDLGQALISAGELVEARRVYDEVLDIYRSLDDSWGLGLPLLGLGRVELAEGNLEPARDYLTQSLAIFESAGDRRMAAYAWMRLGQLERSAGAGAAAAGDYVQALLAWQELGNVAGMASAVAGLAATAVVLGQPERTALLGGASEAHLAAVGRTLTLLDHADYAGYVARARDEVGEPRFGQLWARGGTWTQADVIANLADYPDLG